MTPLADHELGEVGSAGGVSAEHAVGGGAVKGRGDGGGHEAWRSGQRSK